MEPINISVIIPCYNCGAYLTEAIQSALSQEGPFCLKEVLVINDRSNDIKTLKALKSLGNNNKVKLLNNKGPKGSGAARNTGVKHARGDWIAFLDADDIWLGNHLNSLTKVVIEHPDARWVGGDIALWHETGIIERNGILANGPFTRKVLKDAFMTGRAICLSKPVDIFIAYNPTSTCVTMVKKELLSDIGGFDERLRQAQDYDLWIRLSRVNDFWFVPKTLALYRLHDNNTTKSPIPPSTWTLVSFYNLLNNTDFKGYRALLKKRIASFYIEQGYYFRAKSQFGQAIKVHIKSLAFNSINMMAWRGLAASILRRT